MIVMFIRNTFFKGDSYVLFLPSSNTDIFHFHSKLSSNEVVTRRATFFKLATALEAKASLKNK